MRSLLFVPADGGAKLDKAMASGADARDRRSRGFDRARAQGRARARRRSISSKSAQGKKDRPRLLVRINGLDTGLTDADLDAVVPGKPDAILFPKAEGGATVIHLDAKLTAREAIAGLPEGSIKILAQTVETAAGLFTAGTYRNSSARLIGMTWGPEDLSAELGAEANRDADGTLTEPYRLARSFCLFGAAAAKVPAIDTIYVDFRNADVLAPRHRSGAPRRLHRAARDPSGAGAGDQRGVHAERRSRSRRPRRWSRPSPPSPAPAPSASTA